MRSSRSSSSAWRPPRTTSTGCSGRREFSRPAAGRPPPRASPRGGSASRCAGGRLRGAWGGGGGPARADLRPIRGADLGGFSEGWGPPPAAAGPTAPPLHEFLPKYEDLLVESTELRITGKDPARLAE